MSGRMTGRMTEPLIYELGAEGRTAAHLPDLGVPPSELPDEGLLREDLPLPELSEAELVRHYVRLSQCNYGVDIGFYPLGSCTMKYNPKVHEAVARLPGFVQTHPYQAESSVQGNLALMYALQDWLAELGGFAAVSLQPAAGAHGELSGILMIRAYHHGRGDEARRIILVPDSAHGTNPASTNMAGLEMVEVPSDARGNVDVEAITPYLNEELAGMMLTNPNTLGLFEEQVLEVSERVHAAGGLMYGDGANFNALMGIAKPGALGFDVMHYNLHKTFSTPHGGGGPGSGPVGASPLLADYLPGPIVVEDDVEEGAYRLEMPKRSIGRVKSFYGHFGVMIRAYAYISTLGAEGLRRSSQHAVLNANYLQKKLKEIYPLPYDRSCMHEFVLRGEIAEAPDVRALDVCKRLIDYGFHPPTNYFPLIVPEALMIEPTETESLETLDRFIEAMREIAREAVEAPEKLHEAPVKAPLRRLDEVRAARHPILRWEGLDEGDG